MTGVGRRVGVALAVMTLVAAAALHAAGNVLVFDDFEKDRPLNTRDVWQMAPAHTFALG